LNSVDGYVVHYKIHLCTCTTNQITHGNYNLNNALLILILKVDQLEIEVF